MRLFLGLSLVVVASAGCESEGAGNLEGFTVTDSLGIAIVESSRPAWREQRVAISGPPSLVIGALDGDEATAFQQIAGGTRLSDGRIVIADGGTQQVRYFSPQGAHLLTVGGAGEGPGEFLRISGLQRLTGDSVLVTDGRAGRFTVLTPQGEVAYVDSRGLPSTIVGRWSDGSAIYTVYASELDAQNASGVMRPPIALIRVRPAGPADTIARLVGEGEIRVADQGRIYTFPHPFGTSPVVLLDGTQLVVIDGLGLQLQLFDLDGALTRLFRTSGSGRQSTSADLDAYRAEVLGHYEPSSPGGTLHARVLRGINDAGPLPAYTSVASDGSGILWAELYRTPGDQSVTRRLFDASGQWLVDVAMPQGLNVLDIGNDHLLGYWTDQLGVEFVQVYTVTRTN